MGQVGFWVAADLAEQPYWPGPSPEKRDVPFARPLSWGLSRGVSPPFVQTQRIPCSGLQCQAGLAELQGRDFSKGFSFYWGSNKGDRLSQQGHTSECAQEGAGALGRRAGEGHRGHLREGY